MPGKFKKTKQSPIGVRKAIAAINTKNSTNNKINRKRKATTTTTTKPKPTKKKVKKAQVIDDKLTFSSDDSFQTSSESDTIAVSSSSSANESDTECRILEALWAKYSHRYYREFPEEKVSESEPSNASLQQLLPTKLLTKKNKGQDASQALQTLKLMPTPSYSPNMGVTQTTNATTSAFNHNINKVEVVSSSAILQQNSVNNMPLNLISILFTYSLLITCYFYF